ncbi:butyrophilin subfamily 2 member A1-like [Limanda limanda]|uniref:butyrophilin subfamily 2 member A1-like n=1 Tax=Limanda limanda TaxID=27771 RepID=UPI0029C886ED|nr:butyrophilin subfamily 2 member A1-like [Limanda limanda]
MTSSPQFLLIPDQSLVIGPSDPIVVTWGDDITLPCHLDPAVDAVAMTVEWSRSDLNPRYVHVRHEGEELVSIQHPSYKGRTSVSIDKLKLGDVSLNLSQVKLSDNGTYRCFFLETKRESRVDLLVGAGSSPRVTLAAADRVTGAVVLLCESDGWFPEPQMLWLDAEGSLISAGATQSLRRPDGAYRVSSRVTVEKRRSNNFTCRVQELRINQTRETTIHVPDEFFGSFSSRCSYGSWVLQRRTVEMNQEKIKRF